MPTMFVPSVLPAQGHMQVCMAVKAPGAVRGAETLHMHAGRLAGLAPGQNEHVRLDSAKLALCSTPARARFRMHREINRTQGATRNTPQWCDRPGRYSSTYSAMQPAFAEMRACALACPDYAPTAYAAAEACARSSRSHEYRTSAGHTALDGIAQ